MITTYSCGVTQQHNKLLSMALFCQSWSTNSWCVSAGGLLGLSSKPHVIDWQVGGKDHSSENWVSTVQMRDFCYVLNDWLTDDQCSRSVCYLHVPIAMNIPIDSRDWWWRVSEEWPVEASEGHNYIHHNHYNRQSCKRKSIAQTRIKIDGTKVFTPQNFGLKIQYTRFTVYRSYWAYMCRVDFIGTFHVLQKYNTQGLQSLNFFFLATTWIENVNKRKLYCLHGLQFTSLGMSVFIKPCQSLSAKAWCMICIANSSDSCQLMGVASLTFCIWFHLGIRNIFHRSQPKISHRALSTN